VSPHSTTRPIVQQSPVRSPNPYLWMKGKGVIDKEPFNNEPAIFAGNLEDSIYV